MEKNSYMLSHNDWSLHRKGIEDQERHMEKIKEAVKDNLSDLINEESIIMSDGKDKVKIPIRSLDQYRFRYNFNKQQQVGQGDGNSKKGDKIANGSPSQNSSGNGPGAGEQGGEDYFEAEVSVEELQEILFQELELPNLQENKKKDNIQNESFEFTDIRKRGIMGSRIVAMSFCEPRS